MTHEEDRLLIVLLRAARDAVQAEEDRAASCWLTAEQALAATAWEDAGLRDAVGRRDAAELSRRLADWESGRQPLPAPDRALLKRALKAFRKRLKLQRLDDESRIGGGPFSGGRKSSIVAIRPPGPYASEVWEELARQGRLRDAGQGFYELVED